MCKGVHQRSGSDCNLNFENFEDFIFRKAQRPMKWLKQILFFGNFLAIQFKANLLNEECSMVTMSAPFSN
jgi:hypothetical protein